MRTSSDAYVNANTLNLMEETNCVDFFLLRFEGHLLDPNSTQDEENTHISLSYPSHFTIIWMQIFCESETAIWLFVSTMYVIRFFSRQPWWTGKHRQ